VSNEACPFTVGLETNVRPSALNSARGLLEVHELLPNRAEENPPPRRGREGRLPPKRRSEGRQRQCGKIERRRPLPPLLEANRRFLSQRTSTVADFFGKRRVKWSFPGHRTQGGGARASRAGSPRHRLHDFGTEFQCGFGENCGAIITGRAFTFYSFSLRDKWAGLSM